MRQDDHLLQLLPNWCVGEIASARAYHSADCTTSGNVFFIATHDKNRYVLKQKSSSSLDALKRECALLAILSEEGIRVPLSIPTRSGACYVQEGSDCFCLSLYLPGEVITDYFSDKAGRRAGSIGKAIAALHVALKGVGPALRFPRMDLAHEISHWAGAIMQDVSRKQGEQQTRHILEELTQVLSVACRELPSQIIHRDAHVSNILFQDGALSGWLDFDMARRGNRLFDVCYCATSMLMAGLDSTDKRLRWLSLLSSLRDGYHSVSPLSRSELGSIWHVLLAVEVIFVGWCRHHGDTDGAMKNLAALHWIYDNRDSIQGP